MTPRVDNSHVIFLKLQGLPLQIVVYQLSFYVLRFKNVEFSKVLQP